MQNTQPPPRTHLVKLAALFIGVLVPLYLFGSLAEDVLEHEVFAFDNQILLWMHAHASAVSDQVLIFFTHAGSALVLVPLDIVVLIVLLRSHHRAAALFWLLAVGGAAVLNLLAKHAFARTRPDLWLSILPETTFSFPSGHAMQSMAVSTALIIFAWPTRFRYPALALVICFVFLVGMSRVYLGVHYPSDILAGWCASLLWVIGLRFVFGNRIR